ncbi:MAG TPA: hypothetical protein VND62_05345 [Acidimicrobiales bacterium]|nr:hypothetical protein [Acidimicrobiales bacterium]
MAVTERHPPAGAGSRRVGRGLASLTDRGLFPPVVAAVAGTAFVLARLLVVAKGDVSRFVMAGQDSVNPSAAPQGLHVFAGSGYDGQFYYRLGLDPANLHKTAFGITLDAGFRVQRIGMSALAWLASGGQHRFLPDALVGVNLAALVVLAALGGVIARDAGRHTGWGLLLAGYWGFLFSIGRDLPEVVASCFLVGGLVALRRARPVLAGVVFAGAVLTLETTLDVVVAVALVFLWQIARRARRPGARDLAWILPGLVFVAWQLTGWAVTGTLPMRADTGDNVGAPLAAMVGAVVHYLSTVSSAGSLVWLGEYFVLAVVTVFAGWSLLRSKAPAWEKTALLVAFLVAISLARGIWYGRADFRGLEDVYLLAAIVLIGSRHRLWLAAALVAVAWVVTFAHHVVAL